MRPPVRHSNSSLARRMISGSSIASMAEAAITFAAYSIPLCAIGLLPTATVCQECIGVPAGMVATPICATGQFQLTSPTSEETTPLFEQHLNEIGATGLGAFFVVQILLESFIAHLVSSLIIKQDRHLLFLGKPHGPPEHGEGELGQGLGVILGVFRDVCLAVLSI